MHEIKLLQSRRPANRAAIDRCQAWILIKPAKTRAVKWAQIPYGSTISKRLGRGAKKEDADAAILATDLPNARSTRVACTALDADISTFELLTVARKLVAAVSAVQASEVALSVYGFEATVAERLCEAVISAILARAAEMPSYKSTSTRPKPVRRIRVWGHEAEHRYRRSFAEARGNALARRLTMMPSNELTPSAYCIEVKKLAAEHGWKYEFLDTARLKKRGAGAFLAVVQGSPKPEAGIIHLSFRPSGGRPRRRLALVGKGICFDTGGVNVKPNKYMLGMHEDMEGSAVALGTFLALTELESEFAIDCWLALAINHIGPDAYKPNDVVTAVDGTTIEIIHTDAEGRMVLADTLAIASEDRPSLIVDFATLTGACVYSLGKAYSGVFTNRDEWIGALIEVGRASGERVWPFPQDSDYDKALESSIADVKQCSVDGDADHILAGRFLRRFVKKDVPWIHVDLSAGSHRGGLAHIPTDVTGFGVRFTCNLVLDREIMG
jgi:leucyl aminopeptidase